MENLKDRLKSLVDSFQDFFVSCNQYIEKIEAERALFNLHCNTVEKSNKIQKQNILLDVGGTLFRTTYDTLKKEEGSMLEVLFSGRFEREEQADGSVFIDRDPTFFGDILSFLREPTTFELPKATTHKAALYREARYYGMQHLLELLAQANQEKLQFNEFDTLRYLSTNEGKTVTKTSHLGSRTAICSKPMSSGRHIWQIQTDTPFVAIGIVNSCNHRDILPGSDINSWFYFGTTQETWHSSLHESYGQVLSINDIVEVELDFTQMNGCLSFRRNGINMGVAFQELASFAPFYAAVYIYSKCGFSCSITSYSHLPSNTEGTGVESQ